MAFSGGPERRRISAELISRGGLLNHRDQTGRVVLVIRSKDL
jgi:hypothetical protein